LFSGKEQESLEAIIFLIFILSIFGASLALVFLSILQSAVFSFSVFYFARQLHRTRLRPVTFLIFLLLLLNPTLTSSSLVIGYESLVASGHLLIISLLIKDLKDKEGEKSNSIGLLILISLICSLISFLQPRVILGVLLVIFFWVLSSFKSSIVFSLLIVLFISSIFPASLVFRNYQASNLFAVSTNLGATMNLGSGDSTTGGYWDVKKGVPCDLGADEKQYDNKRVKCVLNWYKDNPEKTVSLFFHKSIYFWSPWIGPVAEGTSGRNPWLRYGPLKLISDKESIMQIVEGSLGKFISALWEILSLIFLFYGFIRIYKFRNMEQCIAIMAMILISINWVICLFTIGDNRFRLPISGLTIFLQAAGIHFLFKSKLMKGLNGVHTLKK
jgi:hypothetical protein